MTPHTSQNLALIFIELGVAVIGLAILTRIANRFGFSTIPLYLLAGLAFGKGGLLPVHFSQEIAHIGGEIGVLLLLFMLGLEYTGAELGDNLRKGLPAGFVDFAMNFSPGFVAGLLMKWNPLAAALLGGVTWISSSGVIARVLAELGRMDNPETPTILSILVLEDLAMAIYLPLIAVLLIGQSFVAGAISVLVALMTVSVVLFVAVRFGPTLSSLVAGESDEVILFGTFGLVLLVAGVAQQLQVSSAVGAFLVGIALSGPIVKQTERLIGPMRDLFAATFFLFFGLQIDLATLPPVMLLAIALGIVTTVTKLASGWWAARRADLDAPGSLRAGAALVARGEFSIVIAGLGAELEPRLGPLAAAYVLFLAVLGPILARGIEPLCAPLLKRKAA
jgi:CPA2 family monovalent cation:H+ antiporter-2